MSMRINSLFEHDASMKQRVEEREHSMAMTASNNLFEQNLLDAQDTPRPRQRTASTTKKENGEKNEKGRHRASIACAACRDRRIRCVVPPGERDCTQCKRSKTECIIRNDDERRRPISKAYMSSLTDRVALLEGMLAETGAEIPAANYPPKTRAEAQVPPTTNSNIDPSLTQNNNMPPSQQNPSPRSVHDGSTDGESGSHDNNIYSSSSILENHPPPRIQPSKKEGLVHMLLSTRGHLSFDQLSGRLRFFGPTSNCHIYADNNGLVEAREMPETIRRTERIIRSLSIETHDYLMNLFWEYYNSVMHVVHQESFERDMHASSGKYYSGFLHISILAMGYRFADLTRHDMKTITLGNRECTLHREAKYMLDTELERPGGVPSVQAFLLLGDMECGVGRDNVGWMYAGLANRLCFDLGLHLDCQNDGLPEIERQIRHMTLFACVIYDKYWALFLGRPTGIKSADLELYRLTNQFSSLSACKPAGIHKSLETQIYEELLDLMELAGKITEIQDPGNQVLYNVEKADETYLNVMNLDRQLQAWYRRLPKNLTWNPDNIRTAPFSFFLLHQQYHCSIILLHRPWARYEDPTPPSSDDGHDEDNYMPVENNHSYMSRSICTRQAVRVARIFWHHRQRFDTRRICITGMQHAGTAATALIAALAFIKSPSDRKSNLQYLECLASALQDMSETYHPAASMSSILQAVMIELENASAKTPTPPPNDFPRYVSAVPARRDSNAMDEDDVRSFKKRQLSKSSTRPSMAADFGTAKTPQSTSSNLSTTGISFAGDNDVERRDGYIMITPRSERTAWPNLTSDLNSLDYPMTFNMGSAGGGIWMGGGDMGLGDDLVSGSGGGVGSVGDDGSIKRNEDLDFFHF